MGGDARGAPPPQNLEYLRRAGLPTPGADSMYGGTAGGDPAMSMYQQMLAGTYAPSGVSGVEGAGLPADTGEGATESAPGYAVGGGLGQGNSNNAPLQFGQQANPAPQLNTQSAYNNYAAPSQNLMDYPQQGQPNQPVAQEQPPLQGQVFGQPPSLSQYMPQQGLQIQGNPTAMPVQYTQQR